MEAHGVQYRMLLTTYLRNQWLKVTLLTVLLFSSVGLQLLAPQVTRRFIDAAKAGSPLDSLAQLALLFLGVAVVKYIISLFQTYTSEDIGWRATNALRGDLAAHCLHLDMAFHNRHSPGELIERVDGDVGALAHFFSQMFLRILSNLLLIVGILVLLFFEDWRLGLAFTLFALIVLFILSRMRGHSTTEMQEARQANADLFGFLEERLSGTIDIRSSGAGSYMMRRLGMSMRTLWRKDLAAWLKVAQFRTSTFSLFSIGSVLGLLLGTLLFRAGNISLGTVYLIYAYVQMLSWPVEGLALDSQSFQQANASLLRVSELLRTKSRIDDPPEAVELPGGALAVEFRNVSFSYDLLSDAAPSAADNGRPAPAEPVPQDAHIVLNDVSFSLRPGKLLGLLGRTGSGKTTIARLLLRLYDVTSGSILLNDKDVRTIAIDSLRRHVAVVTQDVQLFQASVRDNLTLFDHSIPDQRIIQAIEELGLGPWFETLPDGLDTELESGGGGLSAGQAQLLAFTRVFLRDPGLVILDEASSRLDPATEAMIEQAVDRLLRGRTAVIIAHRLATVERADEVLILHNGRIVEHGLRTTLSSDTNSLFAGLVRRGLQEELV